MTQKRILIVDDEPGIRLTLRDILKLEHYDVDDAIDGKAALAAMKMSEYDLLIVDLNMPGMGGMELIKNTLELYPDILLIILTAYGTMETAIEALRQRVFDYLLKPISPEQLLKSVEKAFAEEIKQNKKMSEFGGSLEFRVNSPQPMLFPGDVVVDTTKQIITWGNHSISLTPTEAHLLGILCENQDQVVSYSELVFLIHNYRLETDEAASILRPLISRLRHKLKAAPNGDNWIKTVRGTGYLVEMKQVE